MSLIKGNTVHRHIFPERGTKYGVQGDEIVLKIIPVSKKSMIDRHGCRIKDRRL